MVPLLQQMVAWVNVFVAAGGAAVCAVNLGRSRWVGVLMGGFAMEAAVLAFYAVAVLFMRSSGAAYNMGAVYLLASLVGVAARVAVVAGLAGLLSEWSRASAGAQEPPRTS